MEGEKKEEILLFVATQCLHSSPKTIPSPNLCTIAFSIVIPNAFAIIPNEFGDALPFMLNPMPMRINEGQQSFLINGSFKSAYLLRRNWDH